MDQRWLGPKQLGMMNKKQLIIPDFFGPNFDDQTFSWIGMIEIYEYLHHQMVTLPIFCS